MAAIWKGSLLVKQAESGAIESSDRIRITDVYRGSNTFSILIPNRGTFGTGDRAGFVVASANYQPEKGSGFKYNIVWEAGGAASGLTPPSSEIDMQPVELYPRTERNRFFNGITTATLSLAYAAAHGSTIEARSAASARLTGLADAAQKNLGLGLLSKLQRGEETFYLAGWRYVAITYFFGVPATSLGGFIQAPTLQPVSGYFDPAISWLRLADGLQSAGPIGSMWKKTSTWLGAPNGYWDTDLYQ